MASTIFNTIGFYQDTVLNRSLAGLLQTNTAPEKLLATYAIGGDSGSVPGTIFANIGVASKGIVPSAKILMRVTCNVVTAGVIRAPRVKFYRAGNSSVQATLTKTALSDNQLALRIASNPSVDVDTLINPAPALVGLRITKLTLGSPTGIVTQVYDENPNVQNWVTLQQPFTGLQDMYFTDWAFDSSLSDSSDASASINAINTANPSFIWFELTPNTNLVGNTRLYFQIADALEFVTLQAGLSPEE